MGAAMIDDLMKQKFEITAEILRAADYAHMLPGRSAPFMPESEPAQ